MARGEAQALDEPRPGTSERSRFSVSGASVWWRSREAEAARRPRRVGFKAEHSLNDARKARRAQNKDPQSERNIIPLGDDAKAV